MRRIFEQLPYFLPAEPAPFARLFLTEGIRREAARIGCQLIQTDWIQCAPWTSPVEKGMGIALFLCSGRRGHVRRVGAG